MHDVVRSNKSWWRPSRSTAAICLGLGLILVALGRPAGGVFLIALGLINSLVFFRTAGKQERPAACVSPDRVLRKEPVAAAVAAKGRGELEISRRRRGPARFRAYHVIVNETDLGKIRRGQSRVFPLTTGVHEVHLTLDWIRSRSLTVDVRSGERSSVSCWGSPFGSASQGDWIVLARPGESID